MKTFFALLVSGTLLATLGCSGSSSGGTDTGSGGSVGTGGTASGGATGTGGNTGAGGTAGHPGSGGIAGQAGNTGGHGGVSASGGAGGHGGVSASGGAGGHGGVSASGGAGGHGGVSASGGAGGHGGTSASGGAGGAVSCGKNICTGSQYCCNERCGLCAPIGSACIAIACTDGGFTSDAGACLATPALDSSCAGTSATPHYYRGILSTLPPPCIAQGIGNVTNTFCCP